MKIKVEKRTPEWSHKYHPNDVVIARKFAKKVYDELGDFVVALALFGSSARGERAARGDIDILVIIDDVHVKLNPELVETYRIIIAKSVADIDPKRLHVQTMKWTSFWEYVRSGDPVAINILRDSIALIDIGFFDPLQILLASGRIRPTAESIWTYYSMAPASLERSEANMNLAIIDLYWGAIDACHAALMALGEVPPSPSHVADMMYEKMVKPGLIDRKYADIMRHLYEVAKRLMHREIKSLEGKDYDRYKKLSADLVKHMREVIEKHKIV